VHRHRARRALAPVEPHAEPARRNISIYATYSGRNEEVFSAVVTEHDFRLETRAL
jgi:hypothetical protein